MSKSEAVESMIGNCEIAPESADVQDENAVELPTDAVDDPCIPLTARIAELEAELAKSERRSREREEFCRIFPDTDPDDLPPSVMEDISSGIPLSAAFALYKYKRQRELELALEANARNAKSLPHSVDGGEENNFFSADSVRSMSQSQIRENFSHILNSMKHWN